MTDEKKITKTISQTPKNIKPKNLRKAILQAAEQAGAEYGDAGLVSYLKRQAISAPSPFLTLLGKAINEEEDKVSTPIYKIEIVPASTPVAELSSNDDKQT